MEPVRLQRTGARPRVVATVTSDAEAWAGIGLGAEILELRMDLMADPLKGPALIESLRATGAPLIATNRSRREGGSWRGSEEARLALLARGARAARAVDLEASAAATAAGRRLSAGVRKTGTALLISRHDFHATPPARTLRSWLSAMFLSGADVAKVAVMARTAQDLHSLLSVLGAQRRPVVGIAMGDAGPPSRVMAGLFGSVLTYGCVDGPRAPGQIRVDRLRQMVEALQPGPPRSLANFES